jgi:hypothetical protein
MYWRQMSLIKSLIAWKTICFSKTIGLLNIFSKREGKVCFDCPFKGTMEKRDPLFLLSLSSVAGRE